MQHDARRNGPHLIGNDHKITRNNLADTGRSQRRSERLWTMGINGRGDHFYETADIAVGKTTSILRQKGDSFTMVPQTWIDIVARLFDNSDNRYA